MLQVGSSAVSSSKLLCLKMAQFRWQREHHHHHHLHFQNGNADFNPPSETSPLHTAYKVLYAIQLLGHLEKTDSWGITWPCTGLPGPYSRETHSYSSEAAKPAARMQAATLAFQPAHSVCSCFSSPHKAGHPALCSIPPYVLPLPCKAPDCSRVPPAGANVKPSFLVNSQIMKVSSAWPA